MFDKTIFLKKKNCQNRLKGVFVKHRLKPKKPLTKSCPNKQSLNT
jgi:hypothetical protein